MENLVKTWLSRNDIVVTDVAYACFALAAILSICAGYEYFLLGAIVCYAMGIIMCCFAWRGDVLVLFFPIHGLLFVSCVLYLFSSFLVKGNDLLRITAVTMISGMILFYSFPVVTFLLAARWFVFLRYR